MGCFINFKFGIYIFVFAYLVPSLAQSNVKWGTKDYMKREHSLVKPYQGAGMSIPYWDFTGNTMVTSNYIRITPDQQSKQGGLWNSVPIKSKHWELQIHFKVHGHGKNLFGDGFAVWYTKEKMMEGPVFGSKDYFSGLAIVADTYSNHNGPHNHGHPYISAMVNNGSLHYDHDRDGTHTQLAGCEAKFRNFDHDTFLAIRYEKDVLTVSTDLKNKATWHECLRVLEVKLPTNYYLGVTATTGDLSDNHDIISIKFFELDVPNDNSDEDRQNIIPSAAHFEAPRERIEDTEEEGMSGIKKFFLAAFVIVVIGIIVVVVLYIYFQRQEQSRKRFY